MPDPRQEHLERQVRSLLRTTGLIAGIVVIGTAGYLLLGGPGTSLLNAFYMTVITLTTVGFGEIIDLSSNPAGRIFTLALLMIGVGSFIYLFSELTAFMVEGNLDRVLFARRMRRAISMLEDHYIVCGAGATGSHVIRELLDTDRGLVVIEQDEERVVELQRRLGREFPVVYGDAIEDATLVAAGIERAAGLASCLPHDRDNLLVTVSARLLNPRIRIVSRGIDELVTRKISQAGANSIVSPNRIGGLRIVSELVRPAAVSFLDVMLRDKEKVIRVEELPVEEGSRFLGKTVGWVREQQLPDMLILALRGVDQGWTINPADETTLGAGDDLVYLGTPATRLELQRLSQT